MRPKGRPRPLRQPSQSAMERPSGAPAQQGTTKATQQGNVQGAGGVPQQGGPLQAQLAALT